MKLVNKKTCLSLILGLIMTSSVSYADEKVDNKKSQTIQSMLGFDDEICHPMPECIFPTLDDLGKKGKKKIRK